MKPNDYDEIANLTDGFSSSDLKLLVNKAVKNPKVEAQSFKNLDYDIFQ